MQSPPPPPPSSSAHPNPQAQANLSGVTKTVSGEVIVPSTTRADGSQRPELKIKPGFTPLEDQRPFRSSISQSGQAYLAQFHPSNVLVCGNDKNDPSLPDPKGYGRGRGGGKKNRGKKKKRA